MPAYRLVVFDFDGLDNRDKAIATVCAGLGAIPLFPQGIVATVMVATGETDTSWFLATYLPPAWRYPLAVLFILIGVAMYATAWWIARPAKA